MKNPSQGQVIGIPIKLASSAAVGRESQRNSRARGLLLISYPDPANNHKHLFSSPSSGCFTFQQSKVDSVLRLMNKIGKKADNLAQGFREHVRLGARFTETVKGKFSLGAKILQVGGVEKVFRKLFNVVEDEKLLKASQCYLSTTAGPIAGLLFISTNKLAFCSERSIKITSQAGDLARVYYKVVIPLTKINRVNQSRNLKKPSQKYLELVTEDDCDFWFMGFLNYQKTFKYLQKALDIPESMRCNSQRSDLSSCSL